MPYVRRATRAEEQAQRLLGETGFIGPGLTDYMTSRMMEEWRQRADDKPIRLETKLEPALNKTDAQIVDAICHSLGLSSKGQRKVKAEKITEILTDPKRLASVVDKLPTGQRLAVKRVLDTGGWLRLSELEQEFGSQEGDGWFWNERPPTSILGQLRIHGLLSIGQAAIGKKKTHVAVIPVDLREPLSEILATYSSELDALDNYAHTRAQQAISKHYDQPEWELVLPREWVERFIQEMAAQGKNPFQAWDHLEHFDYYLSRSVVHDLDDAQATRVDIWVTRFLPVAYLGEFPLPEKRAMLKTIADFYQYLAQNGRVKSLSAALVAETADVLIQQKGGMVPAEMPPPSGSQVILEGRIGDELIQFTNNDRWLLLACAMEFDQSFDALYQAAEKVVDGETKRELIARLAQFGPEVWDKLIENTSQEEADFAMQWFHQDPVVQTQIPE